MDPYKEEALNLINKAPPEPTSIAILIQNLSQTKASASRSIDIPVPMLYSGLVLRPVLRGLSKQLVYIFHTYLDYFLLF